MFGVGEIIKVHFTIPNFIEKTKIKKEEAGNGPFFKEVPFSCLFLLPLTKTTQACSQKLWIKNKQNVTNSPSTSTFSTDVKNFSRKTFWKFLMQKKALLLFSNFLMTFSVKSKTKYFIRMLYLMVNSLTTLNVFLFSWQKCIFA